MVRTPWGYLLEMASQQQREKRTRNPLPEEVNAGTDNPDDQTAQILSDSDARQADRNSAPGTHMEAPSL